MKKLSTQLLADTVVSRRKALKITQAQLSKATGIHRGLISRLESQDFTPSVDQLQALGEVLGFEVTDLFVDASAAPEVMDMGARFLRINAAFYIPLLFVNIVRLCIQGMGYTRVAMFAGLFEMVARTAVALFVVPLLGFTGACLANPAAWIMADLFLIPCYFKIMRALNGRLLPGAQEYRGEGESAPAPVPHKPSLLSRIRKVA